MLKKIKIGICDDDIKSCEELYKIIEQCKIKIRLNVDITIYYSGEKLLKDLSMGQYFDIIFLDIQLKNIDGLNVAFHIRQNLKHHSTHIYYVTAYKQDARKMLRTRAMDILPKPVKMKDVYDALQMSTDLMKIQDSKEKFFEYQIQSTCYKIPIKEIAYFQKYIDKVIIITKSDRREFYSTIENIYKELKDYDFVCPDRSFLVNFLCVEYFSTKEIKLIGMSEVIPVARSRYANLKALWAEYKLREHIANDFFAIKG